MSQTYTEAARVTTAAAKADARANAEALLRDAAFVLHLTRQVRSEMQAGRPAAEPRRAPATAPRWAARLDLAATV